MRHSNCYIFDLMFQGLQLRILSHLNEGNQRYTYCIDYSLRTGNNTDLSTHQQLIDSNNCQNVIKQLHVSLRRQLYTN